MDFNKRKHMQLSKVDKSSIKSIDEKIQDLCNKINKQKTFYTTSSCSGRIVLLKSSTKKIPNAFLFRTHKKTDFKELKKTLKNTKYKNATFHQTSCILHVACNSINDAFTLVNKAKLAGWKRSGIMDKKRNMVELQSTENISFPIIKNSKILINDEFLKIIIKEANKKLERVWVKIEKLKNLI